MNKPSINLQAWRLARTSEILQLEVWEIASQHPNTEPFVFAISIYIYMYIICIITFLESVPNRSKVSHRHLNMWLSVVFLPNGFFFLHGWFQVGNIKLWFRTELLETEFQECQFSDIFRIFTLCQHLSGWSLVDPQVMTSATCGPGRKL